MSQTEGAAKTQAKPKVETVQPSPAKSDLKDVLSSLMAARPAPPNAPPVSAPAPAPAPAAPRVERVTQVTRQPESPLSHKRLTPQFKQPTSGPDEQVVRQMLRPEKHDRTPFS